MRIVYADNNATTAMAREVVEAMRPYMEDEYFNPSSPTGPANQVASAVLSARESMARSLGITTPSELVFTSGATESNNWAFYGASQAWPDRRHIITTEVEHPAVRYVAQAYERRGYEISWLPVNGDGLVEPASLRQALRPDTLLVSIMHANNETGVLMPIAELADLVKRIAPETLFHSDASQSVGKIAIDLKDDLSSVDLLSFTGHKFHGPKGIGGLFVRRGTRFEPMMLGGPHEHGMRAGTENVAAIVGMAKALALSLTTASSCLPLRDLLQARIEHSLPVVMVVGKGAPRLVNTLAIAIKDIDSDMLLSGLEQDGILASSGSACSSGSLEPSHVLLAMGVPYAFATGALRFSFSRYNELRDAETIYESLRRQIERFT